MTETTDPQPDLPARLEAVLAERFTELGNPFSEMRRHEKGPDGWPASHPVGPHQVAEVLRELLAAAPVPPSEPVNPCSRGASFCGQHGYDCPPSAPTARSTLVEGPQTVSHNANVSTARHDRAAAEHSPRAAEAELYVLLRKAGEDRHEAQALIDRHRDEVLRRMAVEAPAPNHAGGEAPQQPETRVVAYRSPGTRTLYCLTCARQETGWQPVTEADEQAVCDFCGGRVHAVAAQTLGEVVARYLPGKEA
ncbi:hypothetical protein ACFXKI_00855 [Streptomyces mirabilis]|uniref:hypothetical protein n=1 Tax=Streptomyces mirabilis TaxID=68239 RepID=UPI0036BD0C13